MALRATKNNADAQCADAIESMACGASSKECPMALRATKNNADAQCADAMESVACGASSKERWP